MQVEGQQAGTIMVLVLATGGRVSNAWVTYPMDWDNLSKGGLILDKLTARKRCEKRWPLFTSYRHGMGPRPIS